MYFGGENPDATNPYWLHRWYFEWFSPAKCHKLHKSTPPNTTDRSSIVCTPDCLLFSSVFVRAFCLQFISNAFIFDVHLSRTISSVQDKVKLYRCIENVIETLLMWPKLNRTSTNSCDSMYAEKWVFNNCWAARFYASILWTKFEAHRVLFFLSLFLFKCVTVVRVHLKSDIIFKYIMNNK